MTDNLDKCRRALTENKSLTLYQIISATGLIGWDCAEALAELVVLGEAIQTTDGGATVWKSVIELNQQTEAVVGQSASVGTIIGRAS
jgi:hypothetical protein